MPNVQSVDRAFAILDIVSGGASGVTEIASRAKLPKSTVARLLATLEDVGAVEREAGGSHYRLGPRLAEMAGPVDVTAQLAVTMRPHLERLAMQLGEAAGFGVPDGQAVRVITQVESPNPVQVRDYTGEVYPAHVGAPGVCILAEWPEREVQRYLSRPLVAYTDHTVVHPQQVYERIAQVQKDGYCWTHEEFAEGISSVASVVHDPRGRVVGALHAHGPTYRFPAPGDGPWTGELIRATANDIFAAPT